MRNHIPSDEICSSEEEMCPACDFFCDYCLTTMLPHLHSLLPLFLIPPKWLAFKIVAFSEQKYIGGGLSNHRKALPTSK